MCEPLLREREGFRIRGDVTDPVRRKGVLDPSDRHAIARNAIVEGERLA